jgi:DNA-binding NarL/FixJ family response regulator
LAFEGHFSRWVMAELSGARLSTEGGGCRCTMVCSSAAIGNEDFEHLLTALINTKPLQFNNKDGMPLLTRREEDVVRLVADGLKNREIAQRLKLKEHSIRNYLYRIFDKLGVSTRVELILYAFSQPGRN